MNINREFNFVHRLCATGKPYECLIIYEALLSLYLIFAALALWPTLNSFQELVYIAASQENLSLLSVPQQMHGTNVSLQAVLCCI